MKVRVGKLKADVGEILDEMGAQGFELLPIATAHLIALGTLPRHHADPWDHLLMAQANIEGATFMSDDRHTPRYPVTFLPCSGPAVPKTGG